jgi:hypothetical protein
MSVELALEMKKQGLAGHLTISADPASPETLVVFRRTSQGFKRAAATAALYLKVAFDQMQLRLSEAGLLQ